MKMKDVCWCLLKDTWRKKTAQKKEKNISIHASLSCKVCGKINLELITVTLARFWIIYITTSLSARKFKHIFFLKQQLLNKVILIYGSKHD